MKLTFLGLGVMGFPMAGHLAKKSGAKVTVFNRNPERAKAWLAKNPDHQMALTIESAVADADVVMMCVGDDPDVRQVVFGDGATSQGALTAMKAGAVLIDHTTASAELAREIAKAATALGKEFIDAPVSGGQAGAENGTLTIMCGGLETEFTKVAPWLNHYARACQLIGPSGSGQLAKMVNQICIAGLVQGLAEAIRFGQHAELDMPKVLEVIGQGAAASWQMHNRGATMVEGKFNFGFALDWMRKDLRICLDEARRNGSQLPITALIDQFYAELQSQGKGRQDTSSLIERL